MITALMMTAALGLATPSLTLVQDQAPAVPAPAAPVQPAPGAPAPEASFPVLEPATEASDCGRLLSSPAYCVTAPLTEVGALAERYIETLKTANWLAADGDDNRVILVRRKADGTCDGMQMIAFYDESKPVAPTTMGFLGFAVIPGNICRAPETQGPASQ